MARKYSLAYLTIPGTDPVEQIRIAKTAGYDYVSLRTIPMHLPGEPEFLLHKDPVLFQNVRQALADYDMKLNDIELARIRPDLDIAEYEPALEKAAELGATDLLSSIWTRDKSFYTEKMGLLCEMAGTYGISVDLEFLPWAGVRNLQEGITLVDKLNCGNLFLMVDTLHAGRAGVTAEELQRTDKKHFRFMHLCDGPAGPGGDPVLDNIRDELMLHTAREARLYPGEGVMDIAGMVSAIPDAVLSIELPNLECIKKYGAEEHARLCITSAKKYLKSKGIE